MWTRRRFLTLPLGAAAAALLPVVEMPRPGEEWIAEADSLLRRAGQLGPTATAAHAGRLLRSLDAALAHAPRTVDKRPLHAAAAIAGAVAARAVRWADADPVEHIEVATEHARASHDGPALAAVLLQRATVLADAAAPAPCAAAAEAVHRALWEAGSRRTTAWLRADARWRAAWHYAAMGDERDALHEAEWAAREGLVSGWAVYALRAAYGGLLARCGHHHDAQAEMERALAAPDFDRCATLVGLATSLVQTGDVDAAVVRLEEAAQIARTQRAPGRLRGIHAVRAQIPSGPHRARLDDVLRG